MNKKLKEIIENMSKYDLINSFITVYEDSIKKDLEIERLNNKVDELMTLYTTEREVKEDYKSIIKEVREYIEIIVKNTPSSTRKDYANMLLIDYKKLLEILDKGE